jgi:DNA polymerase III epsilon subunit-like protein
MYLILDTETTGITPTSRIVSLSWALYDEAAVEVALAHHVVFPDGFTIPADAVAIHGITTEEARRKGIPLGEALRGLTNDVAKHTPGLLVGHNVAFDRPIVLNEFARLKLAENLSRLPTYCTMQSTVRVCCLPRYNGGYKWPKLHELHAHLFGRGHTQRHDARADVLACAKCFFELRRLGLVKLGRG